MEIRRLLQTDHMLVQQIVSRKMEIVAAERISAFLENDFNYVIAAIESNRVIGFVLAYELQRYDKHNMMYIHEVDVLPAYRRKGIGSRLLEEVKRICKEKTLCKLFLVTTQSNIPACSLYEATGGQVQEEDAVIYCYEEF